MTSDAEHDGEIDHANRVKEGLEEMDHLQYVTVEETPYDAAEVRVRDDGTASNPLVNNGMFALFHRLEYVAHHVDYRENFTDLRYIGGEGGGE